LDLKNDVTNLRKRKKYSRMIAPGHEEDNEKEVKRGAETTRSALHTAIPPPQSDIVNR
jgi:hypothetical protein